MAPSPARTVGPAIASMLIYLLMAVVLYVPAQPGCFRRRGAEMADALAALANARAATPA